MNTRSKDNNTLRPIGGGKNRNNSLAQGIHIWNKAPEAFKQAKSYEMAKKNGKYLSQDIPYTVK